MNVFVIAGAVKGAELDDGGEFLSIDPETLQPGDRREWVRRLGSDKSEKACMVINTQLCSLNDSQALRYKNINYLE